MLRLIAFLVVAAVLAVIGVWLANHPGSVVIDWQGQQLQTSVGILLLAVGAVAVAFVILFEIIRGLRAIPARWGERRRHRRELQGYEALTTGMIAAAAGNLSAAQALRREAERLMPERAPVLLLAAQTAQLEGKEDVAHLKFRQMLRSRETELLGLRGLLAQTMKAGDRAEALSLARRAYQRSPSTPWVLTTLFDLLAHEGRWEEALNLTAEMLSQRVLSQDEARRHRVVLHHMVARTFRDDNRPQEALAQARRGVKLDPGFAPGAVLAGELAQAQGRRRQARRVLEDAWRAAPHPDIARAYARLVDGETAQQRLTRVENRLGSLRPDHPELRVALGELAIAAQNWDKARTELQRALALEPTERVYRLLAEAERGAGNPARAQEWLAQAVDAQPDRAWVCEDTGEALPEWRPFGASGRFDVVHWTTPPRIATLAGREHGAFLVAEGPPSPPATEPAADVAAPPGLGGVDVQAKPAEAEAAKPATGESETPPRSAAA